MPQPHRRFTQEFRDEAVRWPSPPAGRDARSPRISGSACRPCATWLDRRREHEIDHPPRDRQEDVSAELQRLRRESRRGDIAPPG